MKRHFAALALAASMLPAVATTTTSITAGSFSATVKDLNAADGVTAALTWDNNWFLYGSSSRAQQTGYELVTYSWGTSLEARFAPFTSTFNSASSPALSLSGSTASGHGSYIAQVDGSGLPTLTLQETIGAGENVSVSVQFSRGFWLTAGTQVSFSSLTDRAIAGTGYTGAWTPPLNGGFPSHTWANAMVSMNAGDTNSTSYLSGYSSFVNSKPFEVLGEADQVKLIVRNTSTTDQYFWFTAFINTSMQENLDPATAALVPEPTTWALMALGLVGVAGAARRRKA